MRIGATGAIIALAIGLTACAGAEPTAEDVGGVPAPGIQLATTDPGSLLHQPVEMLTDDRYITADGAVLPLRRWLPPGQPVAVILALHGFNDYSNAFTLPAPALTQRGIAVYAYDQRGFGAAPQRGRWAGEIMMARDAARAATLLRRRYPDRPIYLLGESMGGAVAILAAAALGTSTNGTGEDAAAGPSLQPAPVDGVILSAPAVWGRQTMTVFERTALWLARQLPTMQVSQRSLPVTILPTDNYAMLRGLGADPLVIKDTRTDAVNGLVDLMGAALAAAPRLTTPTLVLYGAHDAVVPADPVRRLVRTLPQSGDLRVALYANGYHMLLRDLGGRIVIDDIAAWVGDRRGALPSGADRAARGPLTDPSPVATAAAIAD